MFRTDPPPPRSEGERSPSGAFGMEPSPGATAWTVHRRRARPLREVPAREARSSPGDLTPAPSGSGGSLGIDTTTPPGFTPRFKVNFDRRKGIRVDFGLSAFSFPARSAAKLVARDSFKILPPAGSCKRRTPGLCSCRGSGAASATPGPHPHRAPRPATGPCFLQGSTKSSAGPELGQNAEAEGRPRCLQTPRRL
jgi:hypothetical protein